MWKMFVISLRRLVKKMRLLDIVIWYDPFYVFYVFILILMIMDNDL